MEFNALRINSAPDVLVEEIISQIKSGKLKSGELLPSQRELAKMFNVGLGSVREAIKILDVMGYINVIRGKGTYISDYLPLDFEQETLVKKAVEAMSLADLIQAREIVECGAAKLAATNAHRDNIKVLEELGNEMDASFNDTDVFYQLDFRFHEAIAEASNNKAILEMAKLLVDRSHKYINFMSDALNISLPLRVEKAVASARKVIERIKDKDPEGAEKCMQRHIHIVYEELDKEFLQK